VQTQAAHGRGARERAGELDFLRLGSGGRNNPDEHQEHREESPHRRCLFR
jgi:hypothetical protein